MIPENNRNPDHYKRLRVYILCGLILTAIFCRVTYRSFWQAFDTDEADYRFAMSAGFADNYKGANERHGIDFVKTSVHQYITTGDVDIWRHDIERGELAALRHYHAPLGLYPVSILPRTGKLSEPIARVVPLATAIVHCVVIFILVSTILERGLGVQGFAGAFVGTSVLVLSPWHIQTSTNLSFHSAYGLCASLFYLFLAGAISDLSKPRLLATLAALGAAALTVEYSILLAIALVVSLIVIPNPWMSVRKSGFFLSWWFPIAGLFAAVSIFVLWPPFWTQLAFLKTASIYLGMMVRPVQDEFVYGSIFAWYVEMGKSHPLLIFTFFVSIILAVIHRKRLHIRNHIRFLFPILLYIVLLACVNLRVKHMKGLYGAHMVFPSAVLSGVLTGTSWQLLNRKWRVFIVLAFIALCIFNMSIISQNMVFDSVKMSNQVRSEVDSLRKICRGHVVLVSPPHDKGSVMRWYLRDNAIVVEDSNEEPENSDLRRRASVGEIDLILDFGKGRSNNPVWENWANWHKTQTLEFKSGYVSVWQIRSQ